MKELFSLSQIILALKSAGLGIIIGGIFGLLKFTPPSPDNLAGIFGIIGIFFGWVLVSIFVK